MITIVYAYRNREQSRIKCSLDSLVLQKKQNFNVIFVDYGSDLQIANEVGNLLGNYSFVQYHYLYTSHQPWNKCKAFNFILKNLDSDYCFTADVDMIFHPDFTSVLEKNKHPDKVTYFQVGFLSKEETNKKEFSFDNYKIKFLSTAEATGMSLFPVQKLKMIQGFDEFYHFWGAEDTDVQVRLQNAGCEVSFYDAEILMLHQWHPSYRSRERKKLTTDLQLSGVVQLNHQHLKDAITLKRTKVNDHQWGVSISKQQYEALQKPDRQIIITNRKPEIDHFLFYTLKQKTPLITEYLFQLDMEEGTLKQKIKKILRKKTPQYYSLKEINDFILVHLISNAALKNYSYKVAPDLKSISLIL